mmetsp:Transcript_8137/g.13670  ORF Transcript_8137/g.13670 Transcript_8137/m.13670 type:complete len:266 (+) Transcript_8137:444-1241(+)
MYQTCPTSLFPRPVRAHDACLALPWLPHIAPALSFLFLPRGLEPTLTPSPFLALPGSEPRAPGCWHPGQAKKYSNPGSTCPVDPQPPPDLSRSWHRHFPAPTLLPPAPPGLLGGWVRRPRAAAVRGVLRGGVRGAVEVRRGGGAEHLRQPRGPPGGQRVREVRGRGGRGLGAEGAVRAVLRRPAAHLRVLPRHRLPRGPVPAVRRGHVRARRVLQLHAREGRAPRPAARPAAQVRPQARRRRRPAAPLKSRFRKWQMTWRWTFKV